MEEQYVYPPTKERIVCVPFSFVCGGRGLRSGWPGSPVGWRRPWAEKKWRKSGLEPLFLTSQVYLDTYFLNHNTTYVEFFTSTHYENTSLLKNHRKSMACVEKTKLFLYNGNEFYKRSA